MNTNEACVFHARGIAGLCNKTGLPACHGGGVGVVSALMVGLLLNLPGAAPAAAGPDSPVIPNRTLPAVLPPPQGLEFSSSPAASEITRARVFEEPLVPVGGEPNGAENAALADALLRYARRIGPDDFSSLTGFLEQYPHSPWVASLLTGLGKEYYDTAHYSLALEAWAQAWSHAQDVREAKGLAVVNRAVSELAYLYARLGRMTQLEALLNSVAGRVFTGGAAQKIIGAREALWMMQNRPEVSFRCGPLALHRIKLATDPKQPATEIILNSASTQKGFSLPQVAELSRKVGLNYQMAFREKDGAFVVPSVVHWKAGHYAAILRQEGDRYLVEDPTFGNTVWPTRQALEAESSGYFLIPAGPLPSGWRSVGKQEGDNVWGKGTTSGNDDDVLTLNDARVGTCSVAPRMGMAAPSVHLMTANLQIRDTPLGYVPPVGPAVPFTVRFNQRGALPPGFQDHFGSWTCDWFACINDNPQSPSADVKYYVGGGGARTFTGFNSNNQTYAFQQLDQTLLTRTGTNSYELLQGDGSKKVFSQADGSVGTSRNVLLTKVIDAQGNAVTLTYDTNLLLVSISDAIGQVTTLNYGVIQSQSGPAGHLALTNVTDPFGRSATFDYGLVLVGHDYTYVNGVLVADNPIYDWFLSSITDVLGLTSQMTYGPVGIILSTPNEVLNSITVNSLVTSYGTNTFLVGNGPSTNATMRYVETHYPDGSRERVEYNQAANVPGSDASASVPTGMAVINGFLESRNTYYWDRNACAQAYGDYSKARRFHWLHTSNLTMTSGILESIKPPLENRVWYDYPDQSSSVVVGSANLPTRVGRVLDDGSTQLYSYAYNGFGHPTNMVDPLGRTLSLLYDTNGLDLLEVRQTRAGKNELLSRRTYNGQHRPLTIIDAAGQTKTFTYNARGQPLTATNPKGETVTFTYDPNGYLLAINGALPGTSDTIPFTYDAFGRTRTLTGVSGYTLTFDYDAMGRLTRITYPDGTFSQYSYDLLNLAALRDRAGRLTSWEHDNMQQIRTMTDPLGRVTRFDWCHCGSLRNLTDAMGRQTSWSTDVQGRLIGKRYADGSLIQYLYEQTTSRLLEVSDEKQQDTLFTYNLDDTLKSVGYGNSAIPTPSVSYTYDPDYRRVTSVTDGTGTTFYSYFPITGSPTLGAGYLASVGGPLPNDTTTYGYDELGRKVHRAINGVDSAVSYDAAGRIVGATNALGAFSYAYDGSSGRMLSEVFPSGLQATRGYGSLVQDLALQRITWTAGTTTISEYLYARDLARNLITRWSQQAGTQSPDVYSFGYDEANQVVSTVVTNTGVQVKGYAYGYDPAGNRLSEQVSGAVNNATYNALNQISTSSTGGASRTNEWDAVNRLVAVNSGNQRAEFAYDGRSRLVSIRLLTNGVQASLRRFVWHGHELCEERDASGVVTKRFFPKGVKLESGPNAGSYYYSRDHLGSIRELVDSGGRVRARYAYDPYGRRTRISGDLEADFGFAGMFWASEANLWLTHFRAYDPKLGRWLSRDPLNNAEMREGPNLYSYVANEPMNRTDPEGLAGTLPGLGFNSVTVGLAAAAATEPEAVEDFLVQIGEGGAALASEIQAAAPGLTSAAGNIASCAQNMVAQADTLVADTLVADTVVADTMAADAVVTDAALADTVLPQAVQTVQSIAPQVAQDVNDLEWAGAWLKAMLQYRPPYLGDYTDAAGLARTAEMVKILERAGWIRAQLGLPEFPP